MKKATKSSTDQIRTSFPVTALLSSKGNGWSRWSKVVQIGRELRGQKCGNMLLGLLGGSLRQSKLFCVDCCLLHNSRVCARL